MELDECIMARRSFYVEINNITIRAPKLLGMHINPSTILIKNIKVIKANLELFVTKNASKNKLG